MFVQDLKTAGSVEMGLDHLNAFHVVHLLEQVLYM